MPPGSVGFDVQKTFVDQFSQAGLSDHTLRKVDGDIRDEILNIADASMMVI